MYLKWNEKTISDFSPENINRMYNDGYVFTRTGRGDMYQTRSLRIDLSKFEPSSENKRMLRKADSVNLDIFDIPYKYYNWEIGKLGKDFYDKISGKNTFTANKIKELLTDTEKSNFNKIFVYSNVIGYSICLETPEILHYSYPFHATNLPGMIMMMKAIQCAKENNKKYIYLGSAKDAKAKYKLQFKGLEWFDGKKWNNNLEELKFILKKII